MTSKAGTTRMLGCVLGAWTLFFLWTAPSRAARISDYTFPVLMADLNAAVQIPDPGPELKNTEAVTVEKRDPPVSLVYKLWVTGTQGGIGKIYEFFVDLSPDAVEKIVNLPENNIVHPFGEDAEGLAFAGDNRLLVSNAPDEPTDRSGVYEIALSPLGGGTFNKFLPSDPATRPEGLGVDPADLGQRELDLWIADEGKDKAFRFAFSAFEGLEREDSFRTFERPEGIAVFYDDLLLVDDGGDGETGALVQFDDDGHVVDYLLTGQFGLFDPQGVDFDPFSDFLYVINDNDEKIGNRRDFQSTLLVLTTPKTYLALQSGIASAAISNPEPGAPLVFAAQLLVVAAALRRRSGSPSGGWGTRPRANARDRW
ncbi:MAG: hypothetical protein ACRD1Z_13365 [Vicinamibacteria bacterium]